MRAAILATMRNNYEKAFFELGQGLHSIQDEIAHGFISLPSHLPPLPSSLYYLYIDAFGNADKLYEARVKSAGYVERYIRAIGYNPFKRKYHN